MDMVNSSAARTQRLGRSAVLAAWMMILAAIGHAQATGHGDIDVTAYNIAVAIDPAMQNLTATAKVAFTLKSPYATSVSFELNNALAVSRVTDKAGTLAMNRDLKNFPLSSPLRSPCARAQEELSFFGGRLSGVERSPVYVCASPRSARRRPPFALPLALVSSERIYGGPAPMEYRSDGPGCVSGHRQRRQQGLRR